MKQRLVWADSLKGLLILLVVLGHAIQYTMVDEGCEKNRLWNYIYSFHMPAFMAISGYLSYRAGGGTNRLSIIYKRCIQLVIPYLLWELIYYLTKGSISLNSMVNIFLRPYFWFLWVLFFIIVTFQFGGWISEKFKAKQEIIIIGLGLLYTAIMIFCNVRVLGFQFIAYYYMFYIFGYYIHRYPKLVITHGSILTLLVVIWGVLAWFWNMHELPPLLASIPLPSTMMQYAYRFVTGLIAVYSLLCIAPQLLNSITILNKPFISLGQISLGIYVVHLLLIPYITNYISLFFEGIGNIIIISFVIASVVSWLVVWLLSKWNLTASLLLGKS